MNGAGAITSPIRRTGTKGMIRPYTSKRLRFPVSGGRSPSAKLGPMALRLGTGGVKVRRRHPRAADVLKVMIQARRPTTPAISIRKFFAKTGRRRDHDLNGGGNRDQTAPHFREAPLHGGQVLV